MPSWLTVYKTVSQYTVSSDPSDNQVRWMLLEKKDLERSQLAQAGWEHCVSKPGFLNPKAVLAPGPGL